LAAFLGPYLIKGHESKHNVRFSLVRTAILSKKKVHLDPKPTEYDSLNYTLQIYLERSRLPAQKYRPQGSRN
jgi:hypothetical protein